jgi:CRISPR/Cas system-associated exonuclease Cas4 (RecB family)
MPVQELTPQALDDQLHRVVDVLDRKYGDRTASGEVQRAVFEEAELFRDATVKQYVPVLVQHAVAERLRGRPRRT